MAVQGLFPILRTREFARLVTFYEQAFEGEVQYRFEDVYVALAVGGGHLGIGLEPEAVGGDQLAIWLYTDDVDAAWQTALSAGAAAVEPPADMPWGERVAQVHDPDGNLLYLATRGE